MMEMIPSEFGQTSDSGRYQAKLSLLKSENVPTNFTLICFSMMYPIDANTVQGGVLVQAIGDWHQIRLDQPYDGSAEVELSFSGAGMLTKATDFPYGVYLQNGPDLLDVAMPAEARRDFHAYKLQQSLTPVFIPRCLQAITEEEIHWPSSISAASNQWDTAWLARLLARLDKKIELKDSAQWEVTHSYDEGLSESFKLEISTTGAHLTARNKQGFFTGQAYLFQFIIQWAEQGSLYGCELAGSPKFDYRGVHLDVVRHFFDAQSISEWLDLIALFQYNHFHWHLTDDDGWRVPSRAFPEVTQIGAWRGPHELLPPQMGTGSQKHGGFYSESEIQQLVDQAQAQGITVVPELDIPGHVRALLKAVPALIEADDRSIYRSVQHHDDNVLNPAFAQTTQILLTLIDEWCDLFPGSLFHVGSDEVPKGVWQQSPSALRWSELNNQPAENLQGEFLKTLEDHLQSRGKTMAGWEEVTDGGGVSSDTWVYSWQGVEAGKKAAAEGHNVVMTPAQSCYLDLSESDGFHDPGYNWAGTLDTKTVFEFDPLKGLSDIEAAQIKGVQYCLWSELVSKKEDAEYMWYPRLQFGAQVVWGSNANMTYEDVKKDVEVWNNLLSGMGVHVRCVT